MNIEQDQRCSELYSKSRGWDCMMVQNSKQQTHWLGCGYLQSRWCLKIKGCLVRQWVRKYRVHTAINGINLSNELYSMSRHLLKRMPYALVASGSINIWFTLPSLHYGLSNVIIRDQKFAKVRKSKPLLLAHF